MWGLHSTLTKHRSLEKEQTLEFLEFVQDAIVTTYYLEM